MTFLSAHRFEKRQPDWYHFLDRPRLPQPTVQSLEHIARASVLVTGAAGSIGSALSLQLAALNPRKLILIDASEQALHRLVQGLHEEELVHPATVYLGNTHDRVLLDEIFAQHQPEIIFHAAAYKHVTLLEEHPLATIHNNVFGTLALLEAARHQHSISPRILLLSTDKAADPISILGATKRLAETITLTHGGIAVRLANVLGSEGSVVQSFLSALEQGAPLTITDPQAERYFLTLEESVDLLLSAAALSEDRTLLVPQLTSPHRIIDLANFLVSSYTQQQPTPLRFSQLQPGEKLSEALWSRDETHSTSHVPGCLSITSATAQPDSQSSLGPDLVRLQQATTQRDTAQALALMQKLVTSYKPTNTALSHGQPSVERCDL